MRTLTTLSIAALSFALPSIALAQDPAAPADQEADPAVQQALESAKKDEGAAASSDGGDKGGSRLPVPYAQRPLTLTAMTLAPAFDFSLIKIPGGSIIGIGLGAQFGITDDIQVEATPLSLRFGDLGDGYGIGKIGGTYRILKDDFELGVSAGVVFGENVVGGLVGAPMRAHIGDKARLDTGVNMMFIKPSAGDFAVGLAGPGFGPLDFQPGIPLEFAYNIIDQFWAGASTGFGAADFANFGDSIFVPLGLDLGATIPYSDGKGPMVDINASFGFPAFINSFGGDAVTTEVWQIGVGAKGYFFL